MLIRFSVCEFLCVASVYNCQGTGGWGRLKGSRVVGGGSGRMVGVPQRRQMFGGVTELCTLCTHPLAARALTCPFQPVIQHSALSGSKTSIFTEKKQTSPKTRVLNNYNGGTGAGGTNTAPQRLWVQICFWPWMRFGWTLHRGDWIAVVLSLRYILLSVLGGFRLWNINRRNKCWSAILPMSGGIRHCMKGGHAQKKNALSFLVSLNGIYLQVSLSDLGFLLFVHLHLLISITKTRRHTTTRGCLQWLVQHWSWRLCTPQSLWGLFGRCETLQSCSRTRAALLRHSTQQKVC